MKIFFLLVSIVTLLWFFFWVKVENVTVSLGVFSFGLSVPESQREILAAVHYIESDKSDDSKNMRAAQALLDWEHQVAAKAGAGSFWSSVRYRVQNGETQEASIRRFYAKLFAKKMGKLSAAEIEIRKNLDEKRDYRDLVFLAEIMAFQSPVQNDEIVALLEEALATKDCKDDPATFRTAQANLFLRKGHILFNSQRYDEALRSYLKVLDYIPRSSTAFQWAANTLLELDRIREALDYFDKAITYPNNDEATGDALYNKGVLLFRQATATETLLNEEARKAFLTDALISLDLSISVVGERYSGFPRTSRQKEELAKRHFVKANIENELGLVEAATEDLEQCVENTGNDQRAATCRGILSGEMPFPATTSLDVGTD